MRNLIAPIMLVAVLAAGSAASAAQPSAAPPAKDAKACFRAADVNGFSSVDDKTVDVTVGVRDVYRLTLFSSSPDIDWSQRIGIESRGSSWICSGLDATVIVPGSIGPQRYPVTQIRKLSPDEVALARKSKS